MIKNVKSKFDAEQLHILSYRTIQENTLIPESFDEASIKEFETVNNISLAFNLEMKLIRSQFDFELTTVSDNTKEANTILKFIFVFHCENLDELAQKFDEDLKMDPQLGLALSSITHSTVRGILLAKFGGTMFSNYILPIVKPKLPE